MVLFPKIKSVVCRSKCHKQKSFFVTEDYVLSSAEVMMHNISKILCFLQNKIKPIVLVDKKVNCVTMEVK